MNFKLILIIFLFRNIVFIYYWRPKELTNNGMKSSEVRQAGGGGGTTQTNYIVLEQWSNKFTLKNKVR